MEGRSTAGLAAVTREPHRVSRIGAWFGSLRQRLRCWLSGDRYYDLYVRRPTMLTVEPTNRCNLNCPYCVIGQQNTLGSADHSLLPREQGAMDLALYRKVIDDAVAFGTRSVYLLFMGEPLLHKGIVEMVSVAHNRGLETHIFTNGQLLTEGLFGGLGVAGLDELRFSVDGATAATYERNRVGGHFDRVLANMKMAAQVARERGFRTRLVWQFIAMRNNESEIEDGRRMAAEIGVNFVVKTFAETDPDRAPLNSGLRRVRRPKPCQDIYRNVYVLWNGDVVLCCYDQNGTHVVGNLERETLTAVWNGPRCLSLRRRIGRAIREPANEPAFCRQCAKWTR